MTTSRLPEITLTCANGHQFTTRARGGSSVQCKTCGKSKHVPADRPHTAKEAAAYTAPGAGDHQDQDQEPEAGSELAGRWQGETAWPEKITLLPGRAGDECPECSGPLHWEPRRTLTYCPECKRFGLPVVISEHYARQTSQRAEVAVRQRADPVAEKAARARLRGQIIEAEQWADDWVESLGEPDLYDRSRWKQSAQEFASAMRGWIPEIRSAETEEELAQIKQVITAELINSEPGRELRAAYDESINRAVQEEQRRQYAEDLAERQAQLEAQAAREAKQEEAARRRQEAEESRQRKAAASGTQSRTAPSPATVTMNDVALALAANRQRKEKDLKEKGACEFNHWGQAVAERIYGVPARNWNGQGTGYSVPDTPAYRACAKHYEAAEQRLNREGYTDVGYWDLPIQQAEQPVWGDYGF